MSGIIKKTTPVINQKLHGQLFKYIDKHIVIQNATKSLDSIMASWVSSAQSLTGGQIRQLRGASIEQFVINTINDIGAIFNGKIRAVKGDLDKKELRLSDTIVQCHQVDVHVYRDDKFVAAIECKAYLDKCYYVRACDDFELFRKFGYNVSNYIFAFEDSIAEDAKLFTDFVKNGVCNDVFYMVDGKRSSSKPIYMEQYKKQLNISHVRDFVNMIFKLVA